MEIQEAILHRISKSKMSTGAGSVTVKTRDHLLSLNEQLQEMVAEMLRFYTKSTSGYGTFDANENVHRFPVLLREYVTTKPDLVGLSKAALDLITDKMSHEPFATGGYALFLRYTNQGHSWFLVVMLKLKPGMGVDDATLDFSPTLNLDIEHLHEAARIDLDKWQANGQPYLSFIKKRSKDGKIASDYFREALGCTEFTDSKHNTRQMTEAFEAFCAERDWPYEKKRETRRKVFEYCEAQDKAGEPVNLTALSAYVDDQEPDAFVDFVRANNYEVGETFKPHRDTYVRFKRISKQFGSVKVSFDVQDVYDGKVDYDEASNCLLITTPPDELIKEIQKHKAQTDEPVAG